mmetsp:Transcript_18533/g.44424  ORF Transcript_18533/g.44424 Transcript_18533/m.44424 type:complete len:225 (+) Transcript_18533:916-1590(+)
MGGRGRDPGVGDHTDAIPLSALQDQLPDLAHVPRPHPDVAPGIGLSVVLVVGPLQARAGDAEGAKQLSVGEGRHGLLGGVGEDVAQGDWAPCAVLRDRAGAGRRGQVKDELHPVGLLVHLLLVPGRQRIPVITRQAAAHGQQVLDGDPLLQGGRVGIVGVQVARDGCAHAAQDLGVQGDAHQQRGDALGGGAQVVSRVLVVAVPILLHHGLPVAQYQHAGQPVR